MLQEILITYIPLIEKVSAKYQRNLIEWLFQVFGSLIEIDETINNYELRKLEKELRFSSIEDVFFEVSRTLYGLLDDRPPVEYIDDIVMDDELSKELQNEWEKLTGRIESVAATLQIFHS